MAKSGKTLIIVEMDSIARKEFKRLCTDKEIPMSSVVRRCIKKWVDKQNKNVVY